METLFNLLFQTHEASDKTLTFLSLCWLRAFKIWVGLENENNHQHEQNCRLQAHLHPELAWACHCRASHLNEEEVFWMAAASHVHQLQHHGGSIRVELHKVHRLVGQAKAVDANQVLGLTQAFGPYLYLPYLFECWPRIRQSIVSCTAAVIRILT